MKRFFVGMAVFWCGLVAYAQSNELVVMPNADDFLGPTYAMPDAPVFVENPKMPLQKDVLSEIFGDNALKLNANQPVPPIESKTITPTPGMYRPKQNILTKLPDLPVPSMTFEPSVDTTITPVIKQPKYADDLLAEVQGGKKVMFSAPREVRVSFYPGQSSLSAQALKWIKIFALKVRNDPRLVLEIRVSDENWPLQSKRVALMLQTVMEQGVSRHQIYVYKSPRVTDTVLIGYGQAVDKEVKKGKKQQKTISW
jgi:hypothetical protein